MTDYISREDTVNALDRLCDRVCQYSKAQRSVMCRACPLGDAFTVIEDELPSADVVERKAGKWEQKQVSETFRNIEQLQSAFCPICKRYHTTPYLYSFKHYNFCPNCGTRMVDK